MRNNKIDSLNEITLNSLAQENNLLKKEIEIVKSNLILSDEKEQLHKRTIQQIKKMNKEKEISYKNSINIINEYKKREIGLINKIKEMEIDFSKKEEKLNNEISFYKNELFNKNKIINDLNNVINNLNEQILHFKKNITEKNDIIVFFSKNYKNGKKNNQKNKIFPKLDLTNMELSRSLKTSKSSSNLISKNAYLRLNKTEKKIDNADMILNNEENKNDDYNMINILRKHSCYKKLIPKNKTNQNSLRIHSLIKNYSNKKLKSNSLNHSINKIPSLIFETNINNINDNNSKTKKKSNNNKIIQFKKSFNKNIIKKLNYNTDKTINNTIKEIYVDRNRLKLSPDITMKEKNVKRNNINDFNDYYFPINDIEKNKRNKVLYISDEIKKKKNIKRNKNNIINSSHTVIDQQFNKQLKYEKIKDLYSKKNKLIEINKNIQNKSPNFISNSSLRNISPNAPKEK
jgi:hypothetical protein